MVEGAVAVEASSETDRLLVLIDRGAGRSRIESDYQEMDGVGADIDESDGFGLVLRFHATIPCGLSAISEISASSL